MNFYKLCGNLKAEGNVISMKVKSLVAVAAATLFTVLLAGCQNGKKFDSPEEMISELVGTYEGTGEHSGERVVITNDSIIKFNIDNVYKTPKEQSFFEENYGTQDWNMFDLDTLLSKDYVSIVKEPVSADINNSSLSGLWVDKDGTVFSQREEGYELKKVSEETDFPTDEIKRRFDSYCKRLKEYERSSVISNADIYITQKKTALDTVLSSDEKAESQKCTASAETIAKCAFESIKGGFGANCTAFKLDDYIEPQRDSYGRVLTGIEFTVSYRYDDPKSFRWLVILQSCSPSGDYSYYKDKLYHFPYNVFNKTDNVVASELSVTFLKANNWEVDPNADSAKESSYSEALELAKDGKYESAIKKLEKLDGYKKSNEISAACNECLLAEKYASAISLFKEEKYDEAKSKLADFESNTDVEFWKTKADRAIYLCDYNNAASSPEQQPSSDNSTSDSESGNSSVATTKANTASSVSKKNETDIKPSQSTGNSDIENQEPVESNPQTAQSTTKKAPDDAVNTTKATTKAPATEKPVESNPQTAQSTTKKAPDENKPSAVNTTKATTKAPATEKPVEDPCANGHSWMPATCTRPATCSVCKKTSGKALSHEIDITKCINCDYTDFSLIAKTYNDISSYDLVTGEEFDVKNFKISSSGILSFTFNGKKYSLKLVQKTYSFDNYDGMAQFDCYIDGKKEPDALVEVDTDYHIPRLEWNYLDGYNFYVFAEE